MENINKAIDLMEQSRYTVALTGAGVLSESISSEESGSGDRLWKMLSPDDFTIQRFKDDPGSFYEAGEPFFSRLYRAKPTEVHLVLAELEKLGLIKAVITQNIEGLHIIAGSRNVLEIYGTIRTASCMHCSHRVVIEDVVAEVEKGSVPPLCDLCGEPLKPDVVLPGEPLSPVFDKAKEEAQKADLMVIIGSRMQASPVNQLPPLCRNLIVINRTPTYFDQQAKIVIHDSPAKTMKLLLEELNKRS